MTKSFKSSTNVEDSRLLYEKALRLLDSKSDSPKAVKESLEIFRILANQGYAPAQFGLGLMYEEGIGVTTDYGKALKWHRLAADQDYAPAQCNLGFLYNNGIGVTKDHKEALKWYTLAANQGFAQAQYGLGMMYAYGDGVPQNYSKAIENFQLAGAQGVDEAYDVLEDIYSTLSFGDESTYYEV